MSEHIAYVIWKRLSAGFSYEEYNRRHLWRFDAGIDVPASAALAFRGDSECVDPEEAFVASVSSCHMLTFLALCAKKRIVVDSYEDRSVGHMEKNESGKLAVTRVDLHPRIKFGPGVALPAEALADLHHRAHEECFIANSVKTEIVVHS
jgi:organic hydroperoxide reductase OsmC/OhrA